MQQHQALLMGSLFSSCPLYTLQVLHLVSALSPRQMKVPTGLHHYEWNEMTTLLLACQWYTGLEAIEKCSVACGSAFP